MAVSPALSVPWSSEPLSALIHVKLRGLFGGSKDIKFAGVFPSKNVSSYSISVSVTLPVFFTVIINLT